MTIAEYAAQKQKAMEAKLAEKAKDAIAERTKDTKENDKKALSEFFGVLSRKNPVEFEAFNKSMREQYREKAQTVGTSADGGLLVPTVMRESILKKMKYISPLRQIATVIPNMPANFNIPNENALPTTYWVAEGVAITESKGTLQSSQILPYKAAGFDSFTREVLEDAVSNPDLQNYIEDRFAISIALLENDAFTNGDGSGKPYGFRSSAITPNASLSQAGAAGALAYGDMLGLKYGISTAYRQLAVYVTSSRGVQLLEGIKDTTGRPIFREDITGNTPGTLFGRPLYVVDEIPTNLGVGTNETEVWFGLFQNYFIGDRGAMHVDYGTNNDDFQKDKISLRMIKRVGGRPILGESFAKINVK